VFFAELDDSLWAADAGKENSFLFRSPPVFYNDYVLMINMEMHIMVEAHHRRTFLLMPSMADSRSMKEFGTHLEK